jgi:hypothetical protein
MNDASKITAITAMMTEWSITAKIIMTNAKMILATYNTIRAISIPTFPCGLHIT